MTLDTPVMGSLLWGTMLLRPYVFAFLLVYLVAAVRDLGTGRALGFLLWSGSVAFAAEYASTRVGVPFGLYHYTGATAARELYLGNVPFFDPLSFVFLAYASLCLARRTLGEERGPRPMFLAGVLMMLLDVVIDPLAVRGDRWFLGRIFTYPTGGIYFGVPLSNFAGWVVVGWIIASGYAWATRGDDHGARGPGRSPATGAALYYGVLLFNLAMTLWIGEWALLAAGILVQAAAYLVLYAVSAGRRRGRLRSGRGADRVSGTAGAPSR